MQEKYSLFIGRFQPLHANHIALIRSLLAEGKRVCVAVMDTVPDERNPYGYAEREEMLRRAFGDTIRIVSVPPLEEVCYGREVGYGFRELVLAPELPEISGTRVREVLVEPPRDDHPTFVRVFNAVACQQHHDMVERGFWPNGDRNDGEAIALIMSEAVEVMEALRVGNPPDKDLPEFSAAEVQMADVIGRIMDLSAGRNWRVAEALFAKMQHNRSRPYRHGKQF